MPKFRVCYRNAETLVLDVVASSLEEAITIVEDRTAEELAAGSMFVRYENVECGIESVQEVSDGG